MNCALSVCDGPRDEIGCPVPSTHPSNPIQSVVQSLAQETLERHRSGNGVVRPPPRSREPRRANMRVSSPKNRHRGRAYDEHLLALPRQFTQDHTMPDSCPSLSLCRKPVVPKPAPTFCSVRVDTPGSKRVKVGRLYLPMSYHAFEDCDQRPESRACLGAVGTLAT
jgi:hypothetical protein